MEAIVEQYQCREIGRRVPLRVVGEWVSGIGDEEETFVPLQRGCKFAPRCPRQQQCPLRADDQAGGL